MIFHHLSFFLSIALEFYFILIVSLYINSIHERILSKRTILLDIQLRPNLRALKRPTSFLISDKESKMSAPIGVGIVFLENCF